MKRIRALPDPTPGLADYLDAVDNANWEEFRSHDAGTSHRELRDTLARSQHGLCAYDADRMNEWIRAVLTPDAEDRLPRFFTTARCYFGPVAERILDEPPRRWI